MTTSFPFRKTTALATVIAFGVPFGLALPAAAQTAPAQTAQAHLQIEHDPLTCVTTLTAPLVEAKVVPGPEMASSYVYFRASGTPYFYYVLMTGPVPEVQGVLPRPLPETRALDYFLQATDRASLSRKTAEYAPPVVPTGVCKVQGLAVGKDGAGLTVGVTDANAPVIPPGFNKADIARVILLSGAVVSAAAASSASGSSAGSGAGTGAGAGAGAAGAGAAAGAASGGGSASKSASSSGGGVSSTALIIGGVVVAGGVGAGIALSNNKKDTATPTRTATPTQTPTPTRTPVPNRFVQVEATWSGLGDVNVHLYNPSGAEVGQRLPANCESTASRTERVVLQGTIPPGQYRVTLEGLSCGTGTPEQITTILTIATEAGPVSACAGVFKAVPVGGVVDGCLFTIP